MVTTIGIIGAGFAGLATAKTLREFGFDVTVFEKDTEVGGVWSSSRRYPGLTTQNVRSTYALSDYPYPSDYPEWPTGEQVQRYLAGYAETFGLTDCIHLESTVQSATQDASTGRWTLRIDPLGDREFDFLIICNGIYSEPFVPAFEGQDDFEAAGGRICHTVDFHEAEEARDRHVLVVGYGKSSCDVANAVVGTSASTRVVARHLVWKIPRKFANKLNFKMLLLTRMGENLFPYRELHGMEKFLHGPGKPVRDSMLSTVESVIRRQFALEDLDLVPDGPLETIVNGTVSLETPGFFPNVAAGLIVVDRETVIERLQPGQAVLSNGTTVPCDVVVCGTGFLQQVPFLEPEVQAKVTDGDGNFLLYRQMLPVGVSQLAFNGYNSSFFSQLNAEAGALWIAGYLLGYLDLPTESERVTAINDRLRWTLERTGGTSSKGTNIVPFSMHNVDEVLGDLGLKLSRATRAKEWLLPVDPSDYSRARVALLKQHEDATAELVPV